MFNELSVSFISFHMFFFTDWVLDKNNQTDKDLQYNYGIMMNCFITYYIYANISMMMYYSIKQYWLVIIKWSRILRYKLCGFGKKHKPLDKPAEKDDEDKPLNKPAEKDDHIQSIIYRLKNFGPQTNKNFYTPHFYKLMEQKKLLDMSQMNVISEEQESPKL